MEYDISNIVRVLFINPNSTYYKSVTTAIHLNISNSVVSWQWHTNVCINLRSIAPHAAHTHTHKTITRTHYIQMIFRACQLCSTYISLGARIYAFIHMSSKSLAKIAFPFIQLDSKQFGFRLGVNAKQQNNVQRSTECLSHIALPFRSLTSQFFFLYYLSNESYKLLLLDLPCNH